MGFLLILPLMLTAQIPDSVKATWPDAAPADVESPSAIVKAAYEAISVDSGEVRDVERLRSLFLPEARLIPTGRRDGASVFRIFSMEEFVNQATNREDLRGFHEKGIHQEVERFGDIAHVWTTYESRRSADDRKPFERGINSFQLWHDGNRWWIVSILWHSESEAAPIPEKYE